MKCRLAWSLSVCMSLMQVTMPHYSVELTSTSTPLLLVASSDVLYPLSFDTSYALILWVKWGVPPSAGSVVAQIQNGTLLRMSFTQATDGKWTASAASTSGLVTVNSPVLATTPWTHIAVSVCSVTGKLSLYVTQWHTATTSFSTSASSFESLDPITTTLTLGTGVVGQLLDCRMATSCLSLSDISAIVSEATCSSLCLSGCWGPGDKSCNDYLQLTDETVPWVVSGSFKAWARDDPHLQGRTSTSVSYSFTGWYYQTSLNLEWTNLFRSQNIPGHCCDIGQRVLGLFQHSNPPYMYVTTDLNTAGNYANTVDLPALGSTPSFPNHWLYVAASINPLSVSYCFAVHPDADASCSIFTRSSGSNLQWGTSSTSELSLGDLGNGGPTGKMGDQRYYLDTGLSTDQMKQLYRQRKEYCGVGCGECGSPFECLVCNSGFYLGANSQCVQCNACCFACSGAGNSACTTCASSCIMQAGGCFRIVSAACFSRCATCSEGREWNCLTCIPGYFLQPKSSGICLFTCPTGYQAMGGVCQGSDQVILNLQLDTITPIVKSVNGVEALNGQTSTYYPPAFETSDPRPSQHRGYYFSGAQYMQLPPTGGAGAPLVFPTSLTFTIWMRPQGGNQILYHKDNILLIGLTSNYQLLLQIYNPIIKYTHNSVLTLDKWVYLGITVSFSSVTGLSSMQVYIDGKQDGFAYTAETYIKDESTTATQLIGAAVGLTNFYKGFIWKVMIFNYVSTVIITDFAGPSQPQGLSFQLSPCPFLQTFNCQPCSGSCSNGCVRTTDCGLCLDPLCDVCSDIAVCDDCISHASSIGSCRCDVGYLLDVTARTCNSCAPECGECNGLTPVSCLSCRGNAQLYGNSCLCKSGYFPDPHPGQCSRCPSPCRTCLSAFACQDCYDRSVLDSFGGCSCVQFYYLDTASSNCSPCSKTCVSCSSKETCTSCWPNAQLQDTKCVCSPGYFGAANSCQSCPPGCSVCNGLCESCFKGYFYVLNECLDHCLRGFTEDTVQWVCLRKPNPYTNVTASAEATDSMHIIIDFSREVEPTLKLPALDLSLTDTNSLEYRFNSSLAETKANQIYNLSLQVQSPSLPPSNELTIIFIHPEEFTDEYGNYLATTLIVLTLPPFGSQQQYENKTQIPSVSTATSAAASSLAAGGVAAGLLSGSASSIFALLNTIQMLTYFPLSTVPLPVNLRAQMISMNLQSYFSNPFTVTIGTGKEESSPPEFAVKYGYESAAFLANAGVILATFGLNMGVLLVGWLLSLSQHKGISSYFRKVIQGYRWRNIVLHGIEAYLDLCIAAFLQVRCVLSASTFLAILNVVLGCVVGCLCIALPFFLSYLSYIHKEIIEIQTHIPSWKFLYEGVKPQKGLLVRSYYAFFVFRRLLHALTLVFLNRYALLQGIICSVHSVLVRNIQTVLYLLWCRPIVSRLEAITVLCSEIPLAVLFTLVIAFNFSLPVSLSGVVEISAVICIYAATSIPTLSGFIGLWITLRKVIKTFIKAKYILKVQRVDGQYSPQIRSLAAY